MPRKYFQRNQTRLNCSPHREKDSRRMEVCRKGSDTSFDLPQQGQKAIILDLLNHDSFDGDP